MLRNIKLSVEKVYIDTGSTLVHTGTSYQVSPTPDFTNVGVLIVNLVNSTTSLLEHVFDYNLIPNAPLYVRTRYHFNNGTISSWSNIIELNNTQVGLKSSDTTVATPVISVNYDYSNLVNGEIVITIKDAVVYAGAGTIVSTSWLIESTDGEVLYELPKSTDILTELRLPISVLNGAKSIIAVATTHTNTNADSNSARALTVLKDLNVKYFNILLKTTLYASGSNFVLITEHAASYTAVDIRIKIPDGTVVATYTNLDPYVARFDIDALNLNSYYTAELRAVMGNGTYTPWVEFFQGLLSVYDVRKYNGATTYPAGNMGFGGYLDFNGLSAQTIQADEDDVFYIAVPGTTTLAAYRARNGAVYPIGKTFDLGVGNLFKVPNINYLYLYNGNYILDHNIATNAGNIEVASFTLFDYNHITKILTKVSDYIRTDERYGTGRTSSSVVTRDNQIYYVPGEIFDNTGTVLDLEMRVYDITTNTIIDNIPLPVTGLKENVTISEDMFGNIYMFGGTSGPIKNTTHGEMVRTLLNSDIYKFDKTTKTWTNVYTMVLANAQSYRYKMQTLLNGTIFIIDVTPDIIGGGVRDSYIYDPVSNTNIATIRNNPNSEHLGITIELREGDIGLMSSTADIVESISFLKTSSSTANVNTTSLINSQAVTNLVVAIGETVVIRDPYRYASITISGTSLGSTGKVTWIHNDVAEDFFYNDLIVTRNMTLPADPLGGPYTTFNKVVVVGDAILTIL